MESISKPIGVAKAQTYFELDFAHAASMAYYSQDYAVGGRWQEDELANELGLVGAVDMKSFRALADGRRPGAKYDPEQLAGWDREKERYILREKETGNTAAEVWREADGRWRNSVAKEWIYTTASSAQAAARNELVGQIIEHRDSISQAKGKAMTHRAGWDITFHAPKSVSVTAVYDKRIVGVHQRSSAVALAYQKKYVQARMGDQLSATTGKWLVASFTHDTARPVEGYAAPHLHDHNFWFNITKDEAGQYRSVDPRLLFQSQKYATAVYQAELAHGLRELGYKLHHNQKNHAPEISGYTDEYLLAESPRSQQIKRAVAEGGYHGREAEEIAAHQYRDSKLSKPLEEIRQDHYRKAAEYGSQHEAVLSEARARKLSHNYEREWSAEQAVSSAIRHLSERLAVFSHQDLSVSALRAGQGYVRPAEVESEIKRRLEAPSIDPSTNKAEIEQVHHVGESNSPEIYYRTHAMEKFERDVLRVTRDGRHSVTPLLPETTTLEEIRARFAHLNGGKGLNSDQAMTVHEQATWNDRVAGIRGGAGTGKTSSIIVPLQAIAEERGYQVVGLAPTGKARHQLEKSGVKATLTMQKFLSISDGGLAKRGIDNEKPRLFFVDESSLVSTKQYHKILTEKLRPQDRVIEVGDTRQHESVEAARIFQEQIVAGMRVSSVDEIVRQQPEWYRRVVEKLQFGDAHIALGMLQSNGSVQVNARYLERYQQIAKAYAADPLDVLVVSPDNKSRSAINVEIRNALREKGLLQRDALIDNVYVQRDITREQAKIAATYRVGDVVRYSKGSKVLGVEGGSYGTVVRVSGDIKSQAVTVRLNRPSNSTNINTGRPDNEVTYDPMRTLGGAELYELQERRFAVNDKLMVKTPWAEKRLDNGDTITLLSVDRSGNIKASSDKDGRSIVFNLNAMRHLDYGYVATSYSSQGESVRWVHVHIDTADKKAVLGLNQAYSYVSISRGKDGVTIWTDDIDRAKKILRQSKEKDMALSIEEILKYAPGTPKEQQEYAAGLGVSLNEQEQKPRFKIG